LVCTFIILNRICRSMILIVRIKKKTSFRYVFSVTEK